MFSIRVNLVVCVCIFAVVIEAAHLINKDSLDSVNVLQSNVKLTENKLTRPGDKQIGQRVEGDVPLRTFQYVGQGGDKEICIYNLDYYQACIKEITFVNATNQGQDEVDIVMLEIFGENIGLDSGYCVPPKTTCNNTDFRISCFLIVSGSFYFGIVKKKGTMLEIQCLSQHFIMISVNQNNIAGNSKA
ncbi:hypothetical protein HHI36_021645 [Cryptolaemus montrouzieri]|uniref:Uncharacterized protein n=1 Tax=Cryptolaemus montrouzieri TaxID=559131 RepID=A0ABD2MY62_9CUCU